MSIFPDYLRIGSHDINMKDVISLEDIELNKYDIIYDITETHPFSVLNGEQIQEIIESNPNFFKDYTSHSHFENLIIDDVYEEDLFCVTGIKKI